MVQIFLLTRRGKIQIFFLAVVVDDDVVGDVGVGVGVVLDGGCGYFSPHER